MLGWVLSWSGSFAFLLGLCAPILIVRHGTATAKWLMLAVGLLSAASIYYNWTVDFDDEVLVGTADALGLLLSILVFLFGNLTIAITLAIQHIRTSRKSGGERP